MTFSPLAGQLCTHRHRQDYTAMVKSICDSPAEDNGLEYICGSTCVSTIFKCIQIHTCTQIVVHVWGCLNLWHYVWVCFGGRHRSLFSEHKVCATLTQTEVDITVCVCALIDIEVDISLSSTPLTLPSSFSVSCTNPASPLPHFLIVSSHFLLPVFPSLSASSLLFSVSPLSPSLHLRLISQ